MKRKFTERHRSFWEVLTSEVSKPALFEWTDTLMENTGYDFKETKTKSWISMLSNEHFEYRIRWTCGTDLYLAEAKDSHVSIQLLPRMLWSWADYCPNRFGLKSSSLISSFPQHVGPYKEDVSCHAFWPVLGRPHCLPANLQGHPVLFFPHSSLLPKLCVPSPACSTYTALPPPTAGHQGYCAAFWLQESCMQSFGQKERHG